MPVCYQEQDRLARMAVRAHLPEVAAVEVEGSLFTIRMQPASIWQAFLLPAVVAVVLRTVKTVPFISSSKLQCSHRLLKTPQLCEQVRATLEPKTVLDLQPRTHSTGSCLQVRIIHSDACSPHRPSIVNSQSSKISGISTSRWCPKGN